MIHGDLKGVRLRRLGSAILLSLSIKANIVIDQTGHARLADFGLLTVISDPTNGLSSNSTTQGGTFRWMSPELIDPEEFGFKKLRLTKSSDCYALGMVIYETITGRLPFHQHHSLAVLAMVLRGKRPPREKCFTDSLWRMLELCWQRQPADRPKVEEVLQCLETEQPSPWPADVETEDSDNSDSWDNSSCELSHFTPPAESHRLRSYVDFGMFRISTRSATLGIEERINSWTRTVRTCACFHTYAYCQRASHHGTWMSVFIL